jgi:hypothetical protein
MWVGWGEVGCLWERGREGRRASAESNSFQPLLNASISVTPHSDNGPEFLPVVLRASGSVTDGAQEPECTQMYMRIPSTRFTALRLGFFPSENRQASAAYTRNGPMQALFSRRENRTRLPPALPDAESGVLR